MAALLVSASSATAASAAPPSMGGLSTASQTAADQVSCGDTITRNTTLHSDLTDCPRRGLVIGADGVNLNLNGHTISGAITTTTITYQCEEAGFGTFRCTRCDAPGYPSCGPPFATAEGYLDSETFPTGGKGAAIDNRGGFDRVTVRNGFAKDFNLGAARFDDAHGFKVVELRDAGSTTERASCDVCVVDSQGGQISGTDEVFLSGTSDTVVQNAGDTSAFSSDRNTFRRVLTLVLRNGSDQNLVERNAFDPDRSFGGVYIHESSANVIRHNSFVGPQALSLDPGANRNIVENNVFTGGSEYTYSIPVLGAFGNIIRKNRISESFEGSVSGGIGLCDGSSRNVIEDNRITDMMVGVNLGVDSSCEDSGPKLTNNVVRGNRITDGVGIRGSLSENSGDGIMVGTLAKGTLVDANSVLRNSGNGITVLDPSTRIARNVAIHNAGLGISAPPGAIDLGGNRAAGNGNPLQCLNVVCK